MGFPGCRRLPWLLKGSSQNQQVRHSILLKKRKKEKKYNSQLGCGKGEMWSGYFTKDGIKTGFERHKCTGNTGVFDTGCEPVGINAAAQKTVEWNESKF